MTLFWLLISCTTENTFPQRGHCNPIETEHCMFPYPSDFYLLADSTMPNGVRLNFDHESLPVNVDGLSLDADDFSRMDGYSIGTSLFAYLPNATITGAPQWPDLEGVEDPSAPVVLVNTVTNARVPITVERELQAAESGRDALIIRPMRALESNTQYVVGISKLVDSAGAVVPAASGFAELLSGITEDPDLLRQQEHYETVVLPVLEQQGMIKNELQLAWSFTTQSEQNAFRQLRRIEEDAFPRMQSLQYEINEVVSETCEDGQGRVVKGTVSVPLYLESDSFNSSLVIDDFGLPVYNGQSDVDFTVVVGCALLENPQPGQLIQYGHGLFGDANAVDRDTVHQLAAAEPYLFFGTAMRGMSRSDAPQISLVTVSEPERINMLADRLHQGWLDNYAVSLVLRQSDFLNQEALMHNGQVLADPSSLFYYGNSQGAIIGGGYTAWHPDIERVSLGVGGMAFSLFLTRTYNFEPFLDVLEVMYEDWLDISLITGLLQQFWTPVESVGWAHLNDKELLFQTGKGDNSVPAIAAHYMARSFELTLIEPVLRPIPLVESAPSPVLTGRVFSEWGFGVEDAVGPTTFEVENDQNAHELLRNLDAAQLQVRTFFNTGEVHHYCDGVCDPE